MPDLWSDDSRATWRSALDRYPDVVARQGVPRLAELDRWYRDELPAAVAGRTPAHALREELVRLAEWKMARGVWRAPNLVLVRGNAPEEVVRATGESLALAADPRKAIARLATLAGVGPATASALLAAAHPDAFPFFDELVAAQVPELGPVAWTPGYYHRYAERLRERARALGGGWSPAMVERALWAHVGGKAGAR